MASECAGREAAIHPAESELCRRFYSFVAAVAVVEVEFAVVAGQCLELKVGQREALPVSVAVAQLAVAVATAFVDL